MKTTIIPVPKNTMQCTFMTTTPVSLISIIMKCFVRLVIATSTPVSQLTLIPCYQCNMSTADIISLALHSSLEHLNNKDTYIRLLLINYSSTFNTIIPSRLISKLHDIGLGSTLCSGILSFLTQRPQSVKIGGEHTPIYISRTEVEGVKSVKFLGVTITNNLSRTSHKLQKVVRTAQIITEANLPSMDSIYMANCCGKSANIIKDTSHPVEHQHLYLMDAN
eukprot:g31658.t1